MKITPKGIHRNSNSNTLTLEKAAAIICNARLQGETFKFVGQKIKLDSGTYIESDYEHFYWHSKIGEKYIIGVNTTSKTISILPIDDGDTSLRNFLLSYNWENDSRGFIYSGDFIGITHLNDIIVVDTTSGKYFFYWDEKADNNFSGLERGNFVWLNELPIPVLNVEKHTAVDNIRIGAMQNTFTDSTSTQDVEALDDDKFAKCRDEFGIHLDSLLKDALKNNIVNGAFYVRAAYKLYDGTYIYPSNPIFVCDYTDGYEPSTDTYSGVTHLNVLRTRYEKDKQYSYKYHTFLETLQQDYISGTTPLGSYKSYYDNLMSNLPVASDIYTFQQELLQSYRYKWKIQIPVNTLDIIKKWYDKGIITSIELFITKPDKFLNIETCHKYLIGNGKYNVNSSTDHNIYYKWFKTPIHFNKDIIEPDLSKKIFYKIDSIKDFADGIDIDYSQDYWAIKNKDPFVKFKNAIDIETNETLPLDNSYLIPKSDNYKVYNNMIHLLGVKNYYKSFPLSFHGLTSFNGYSDCELHYLVSDGTKDYWIKVNVPKFGMGLFSITLANNILYFPYYRAKKVNITFLKAGTRYILKSINLTPHIAHNLSLDENHKDFVKLNGFITVGITPTSSINYSKITVNVLNGTFQAVDYDTTETHEEINRMQLSATDNPFIYPANRSFRFGDIFNKVIGAESSSIELQDYNFGKYPMYVFTNNGIFVMEVGSEDIAYITQHLFKEVKCINNKNIIKNCKGAITLLAEDGMCIISGGRITNVTKQLEGNNNIKEITILQNKLLDSSTRFSEVNAAFKNAVDYFFVDSHAAFDELYNEIIFINSNYTIQFVFHLESQTFSVRTDKVKTRRNYIKVAEVNSKSILCADVYGFWEFYSTYEYDKILNVDGKGNMLIASTIIPVEQYNRLRHLVTRFELSPILLSNTDILRYSVSLYVIGSRDGVDWKVIAGGTKTNVLTSMNSLEIRRAFTSVRYLQVIFFATYDDMNSVAVNQILSELYTVTNDVILTNSFSEFDLEILKEHNTKLR